MNKTELITTIAEKTKITKALVSDVVEIMFSTLIEQDRVSIKEFGVFNWKTRPARKGRNPHTGATIDIPETKTLTFKVASGLKTYAD
ncbi:MAG: HU family DNA-binding protein [Deltaproteobacteria bacterium]